MSLVDMRIDMDDYLPKVSVGHHRRSSSLPLSPFTIVDGGYSRRSSVSYSMLPEEPLKLSILKLDGSCFDVEVMKSATVAELRQAIEAVFSHMPRKGPGKISWPHVWSHFCLMFEGQKLVRETDYIGYYGIRDGDQLQFIRHISTSYSIRKKRSMKRISASEQHRNSLSSPYIYEEKEHDGTEDDSYDVENGVYNDNNDIDNIFKHKESRWAGFIQRLFPYSRLPTSERSSKGTSSPSRSACGVLGNFRKMIQFCGDSHYS
ncbi:uncharacterized protein LOC8259439 [Ricinus communis]|uniref:uncharacterized protein LOC8259439 n=1 Tax=Ricinus communis TaxID=3988 RepID=UPI0007728032|nr:uncharacterized protein LOC8259439 [Ricinus communis]|eukprot:XP_015572605.1 uncharacterized protein LOC8259439 [Ricinus communis]